MFYKKLYVNGCSHTAGGGLDSGNVKKLYKEFYDVTWDKEKEITYPKYVAEKLDIGIFNDAQSGSGAPRLIRRTWEYISHYNLEELKKTIFLLQINNPINRVEYFCKKINDYLIINCHYNNDLTFSEFSVVHRWTDSEKIHDHEMFKGEIEDDIRNFMNKYHDPFEYQKTFIGQLIGLFSFFILHRIEFFFIMDDHSLENNKDFFYKSEELKKRRIEIDGFYSINPFCHHYKNTIKGDLNGLDEDTHPGYFGHKMYGEKLSIEIEKRLFGPNRIL